MRTFNSFGAFGAFLGQTLAKMQHERKDALEAGAKILLDRAREIPGHYQPGWPELKAETIARKATGDSPELERGDLVASYEMTADDHAAHVGSNLDVALYQEMGTSRLPPRPILGAAVAQKGKDVAHAVAEKYLQPLVKG